MMRQPAANKVGVMEELRLAELVPRFELMCLMPPLRGTSVCLECLVPALPLVLFQGMPCASSAPEPAHLTFIWGFGVVFCVLPSARRQRAITIRY